MEGVFNPLFFAVFLIQFLERFWSMTMLFKVKPQNLNSIQILTLIKPII